MLMGVHFFILLSVGIYIIANNQSYEIYFVHLHLLLWKTVKNMYTKCFLYRHVYIFESRRGTGAQVCDCKHNSLWIQLALEEKKKNLRSGNEAKRNIEFCHFIRNASGIRHKTQYVLDTACKKIFVYIIIEKKIKKPIDKN